jgi:hypothetical protein
MAYPNLPDKSNTIKPHKLLDRVYDKLCVKLSSTGDTPACYQSLRGHSSSGSIRTEQAFAGRIRCFIFFRGKRHPKNPGAEDVETFHACFSAAGKIFVFTQNQAKSVLLFASSDR